MLGDESLDAPQLDRGESKVTRQCDRHQPELRRLVISVDVDVRWLVQDQILQDFPDLTRDDIRACLAFAADRERKFVSVPPA